MKHQPNDLELEMLSLPAAYGGMTFDDPVADSRRKHADSIKCTATLTDLICADEPCLPSTVDPADCAAKAAVRRQHQLNLTLMHMADAVQGRLPDQLRRAMMVAREKGCLQHIDHHPRCRAWVLFRCETSAAFSLG